MDTTQSFVGGESVASPQTYDNFDPSSESLGPVARGGEAEVERAVGAARAALRDWRRTAPSERARLLKHLGDLIERSSESLARTESEDTGKPLSQARTDAGRQTHRASR